MKKLKLLLFIITYTSTISFAQNKSHYTELRVNENMIQEYTAELYTDSNAVRIHKTIKDSKGQKMKFAAPIDALNYTVDQGWELMSSYTYHNDIRFILRKR